MTRFRFSVRTEEELHKFEFLEEALEAATNIAEDGIGVILTVEHDLAEIILREWEGGENEG